MLSHKKVRTWEIITIQIIKISIVFQNYFYNAIVLYKKIYMYTKQIIVLTLKLNTRYL